MSYPTSANFKTWAGISGSGDDMAIGYAVDGAIAWFERTCSRLFVAGAATKTFPVRYPYVDKRRRRLSLFEPLMTITTLTNGDDDVLTVNTEYVLYPVNAPYRQIRILESCGLVWTDNNDGSPISVEGTWGHSAACPDDVFEGILLLAQADYHARGQGGGGVTQMVTQSGLVVAAGDIPPRVLKIAQGYKSA